MSFKDLEEEIKNWVELGIFAQKKKAEAEQRKEFKRQKNKRGPMYKPDRPPKYEMVVKMNLRKIAEGLSGDLITKSYTVDSLSEVVAELEAMKLAKNDGYAWRGTVSITRKF